MRRAPLALLLVASTALAAVPTVAVLPFRDLSGGKASVGEAIRETVTSDLKTLGGVRVVKLIGATLIAVGAYQQAASDVRLTARFVQVDTGEIVGTAKVDGRASEF